MKTLCCEEGARRPPESLCCPGSASCLVLDTKRSGRTLQTSVPRFQRVQCCLGSALLTHVTAVSAAAASANRHSHHTNGQNETEGGKRRAGQLEPGAAQWRAAGRPRANKGTGPATCGLRVPAFLLETQKRGQQKRGGRDSGTCGVDQNCRACVAGSLIDMRDRRGGCLVLLWRGSSPVPG